MKKLLFMAGLALLLAACSTDVNNEVNNDTLVPVTVRVNGFSIAQDDFSSTRTAVGDYTGLKVLTLAFYDGDTEVYKATQTKGSMPAGATFGNFSLDLPLGSYTMVVLGYVLYDDDALTLTSPSQAEYTGGCPRETFSATQQVSVTSTNPVNLSANLERIITCLQVISTDGKAANVKKVRMTFSAGGRQFSPLTGFATANTGSVSTVNNSASVGATSTSTGFVFLTADEQTMNVTIETLDASGNTLYSTVVENVPFQRNRRTKLTGTLYPTASATSSFSVTTTWNDDHEMSF